VEFLRHYTFDSGISQEVRGEGNELVGLVSVWDSGLMASDVGGNRRDCNW
jgi:hypothetical protein